VESYAHHARFAVDLGAPAIELLAPQPGEAILDLGCGDRDTGLSPNEGRHGCELFARESPNSCWPMTGSSAA
jgi:hypothetical protein